MDDIANARKLAQDILDSKKISSNKDYFEDDKVEKQFDTKLKTNSEPSLEESSAWVRTFHLNLFWRAVYSID